MRIPESKEDFQFALFVCLISFLSGCELNPLSSQQRVRLRIKMCQGLARASNARNYSTCSRIKNWKIYLKQMKILKEQLSDKLTKIDPADVIKFSKLFKRIGCFLKDKQI